MSEKALSTVEFERGLRALETNFNTSYRETKIFIWEQVKNATSNEWKMLIGNLIMADYPPRVADFYIPDKQENPNKYPKITCARCGKKFTPKTYEEYSSELCPDCIAYFQTPEGQAEIKENVKKLKEAVRKTQISLTY